MRLWEREEPGEPKPVSAREYETAGFVIEGKAEMQLEGQTVLLEKGDSWIVPKGSGAQLQNPGNLHRRRSNQLASRSARAGRLALRAFSQVRATFCAPSFSTLERLPQSARFFSRLAHLRSL